MWPWEHAAVAYIGYSSLSRLSALRTPDTDAFVAVLLGSQGPDLIDKPLAWWLQVLPSGRSLGHSVFFALPLVAVVFWAARLRGRTDVGVAFAIGYLSHLPADVIYPVLLGEHASVGFLFYPLVAESGHTEMGAIGKVTKLAGEFAHFLQTPRGTVYLGGELLLLLAALWLWIADGKPGLGTVRRRLRHAISG